LAVIVAFGLFFVAGCSRGPAAHVSPIVLPPAPAGWTESYQYTNGIDFYVGTSSNIGLLMFSKWFPASQPGDIPGIMKGMASDLAKSTPSATGRLRTLAPPPVQTFTGPNCRGYFALLHVPLATNALPLDSCVFMMTIDGEIWNGQFNGKPAEWDAALGVLKQLKKR